MKPSILDKMLPMRATVRRHFAPAMYSSVWLSAARLATVVLVIQTAFSAKADSFAGTGSLNNSRDQHTATLLPNGKVLVAGGFDDVASTRASAELYNPATGTWTTTGSLNTARMSHAAALLPNGKVLVAGGNWPSTASAELYDPSSGTWTNTGSMSFSRVNPTATLLPNGKVLVAGGYDYGHGFPTTTELYDPSTGTWTNTGSMSSGHWGHCATLLANGTVMVDGGATTVVEIYDPATGVWTNTGSLNGYRDWHTSTLLADGKVLIAGGRDNANNYLSSAELYDPAAGTWTTTGSMSAARYSPTATLLSSGKVLVAGGFNGSWLSSAELYNPCTGTFSSAPSMGSGHAVATETLLPNGKVLIAAGRAGMSSWFAELYTPDILLHADVYVGMEGQTNGAALTEAILNNGTHGDIGDWDASNAGVAFTVGSHLHSLHNPVSVSCTTYPVSTNSHSIAFDHDENYSYLNYWLDDGPQALTVSGFITFGPAAGGYNSFYYIGMNGNLSGQYVSLRLYSGTGSNYALSIEANPGGDTTRSSDIPITPGGTYWVSLRADYNSGTARLAVYETSGWTQVGNVSVAQSTGESIEKFNIGNGGDGTSSGDTSYFENLCFDQSNAAFPFGP